MSFSQLRISSDILKGLKDVKIESPSPLQKKIINAIKDGGDLLISTSDENQPETGYLVPVLDQIVKQDRRQGTKAIILTDHPERAASLVKWIRGVGYHAGIESVSVTNTNTNGEEQRSVLSAGPPIVVATPDRLSELMEQNRMIFRETQYLILDHVDETNSWEFIEVIVKRIIGKCQRIASIEHINDAVNKNLDSFLRKPETIGSEKKHVNEKTVSSSQNGTPISKDLTQYYIKVPPRKKISTLMAHLETTPTDTVLIFTASRRTADRLYRVFRKSGLRAVSLHDRLDKDTFRERYSRFQEGNVQHLIVGQLSASDLSIDQVTQVINYDVPEEVGEYKLRADLIGDGKATRIVSLVSKQDRGDINEIISELGYAPEEIPLSDNIKKKRQGPRGKSKGKKSQKRSEIQTRSSKQKRESRQGKDEPMGLPRPSYDKLSGGRSGSKKKEETGIVGFFKKLFS